MIDAIIAWLKWLTGDWMIDAVAFPLLPLLVLYVFWLMFLGYAAVQNAGWAKLPLTCRILLIPAGVAFVSLDVLLNATLGSLLFLQLPSTWTFSARCAGYVAGPAGWRRDVASKIVGTVLLPFTKNY